MPHPERLQKLFDCGRRPLCWLLRILTFGSFGQRPDMDSRELPTDPAVIREIVRAARTELDHAGLACIDPEERMIRRHPEGIEVRAWRLVRHGVLAAERDRARRARTAFAGLPRLTREIVTLCVQQRLDTETIAHNLGISPLLAREHLRLAIRAVADAIDQA
jgi:DNA-directed RNA polymerase specialized sigma24 family protein